MAVPPAAKADGDMRQPTCLIPHGGGPCFFMDRRRGPPDHVATMADYLADLIAVAAGAAEGDPDGLGPLGGAATSPCMTARSRRCSTIIAAFPSIPIGCAGMRPARRRSRARAAALLEEAGFATARGGDARLGPRRVHPDEGRGAGCGYSDWSQLSLRAGARPGRAYRRRPGARAVARRRRADRRIGNELSQSARARAAGDALMPRHWMPG